MIRISCCRSVIPGEDRARHTVPQKHGAQKNTVPKKTHTQKIQCPKTLEPVDGSARRYVRFSNDTWPIELVLDLTPATW